MEQQAQLELLVKQVKLGLLVAQAILETQALQDYRDQWELVEL